MKVIGVSGSPRKNGNTAHLVGAALREMEKYDVETVFIRLCEYAIGDCRGCEGCRESYHCVIRDDMQKLYPLLDEADALILGSPTYFYDVTALMKAFLDRLYCYEVFDEDDRSVWMSVNEARGGKLASVFSVCEQERAGDTGYAAKTMGLTLGSLGYRVVDSVQIINLFKRDEAAKNQKAMDQAKQMGERLAKTMRLRRDILNQTSPGGGTP